MKKKKIVILLVLLIILLIILGFLSYIFFNNLKEKQQDNYIDEITLMGETFYSDYYYKVVSINKTETELIEYLKKFETIGLKFDLSVIETYNDDYSNKIKEFVQKYETCKKENIIVTIYPKSPYSNKDYDSKIQADCSTK